MNSYLDFSQQLFSSYNAWKVPKFSTHVIHREVEEHIQSLKGSEIKITSDGVSFEGRRIYLLSLGNGKRKIFSWTQMHGDESTATKAVFDILNFFLKNRNTNEAEKILSECTLYFLPMVNPDGAERNQRRNAQNIDINRDAQACQTLEARLLHGLRLSLRPEFGFNLHDQELSTVSNSKEITALSLLAPAFDEKKSENETRTKAKRVASVISETMKQFIPNNLARYNDDFEPRAFGDTFQKFGVSTVLLEAGHSKNDTEKKFVRKLYAVSLFSCFYAIATNDFSSTEVSSYEQLPFNGKKAYDLLLRNAIVKFPNEKTMTADIGISYQVDTHSEFPPKIADVGDLSTFSALHEIDASGVVIPQEKVELGKNVDVEFFQLKGIEFSKLPW
ncbi:MAG: hypothetical protein KGZ58_04630 [Ignavibacteriales bacterium]|nr:hypothetical protein [Ignavibacteriales bacterium]